ncbi:MAG TPA: PilZ domain-containing protein [Pyrinomonadaceae bacterium]|nr:PilZ domain-containing protein [Pyrinomonadaceae bacterium]
MTQVDQPSSSLDLHLDGLIARAADGTPERIERRRKPRISEPFPARIWGVDSGDLPFNVDCVLDNISSTGLYLRMPRRVNAGSEVRLIVHLLSGPTTGVTAAIQGQILRTEVLADGKHGHAIAINKHRFL